VRGRDDSFVRNARARGRPSAVCSQPARSRSRSEQLARSHDLYFPPHARGRVARPRHAPRASAAHRPDFQSGRSGRLRRRRLPHSRGAADLSEPRPNGRASSSRRRVVPSRRPHRLASRGTRAPAPVGDHLAAPAARSVRSHVVVPRGGPRVAGRRCPRRELVVYVAAQPSGGAVRARVDGDRRLHRRQRLPASGGRPRTDARSHRPASGPGVDGGRGAALLAKSPDLQRPAADVVVGDRLRRALRRAPPRSRARLAARRRVRNDRTHRGPAPRCSAGLSVARGPDPARARGARCRLTREPAPAPRPARARARPRGRRQNRGDRARGGRRRRANRGLGLPLLHARQVGARAARAAARRRRLRRDLRLAASAAA
jgi:hypothetical protein